MLKLLYQLIGQILIVLASIYELFWWLRERIYTLFCESYDYWRSKTARERCERAILEQCKSQLTKRPRHLAIVIAPGESYVDVKLLKRLFKYALFVGIEQISMYDTRDRLNGYIDLSLFCASKEGRGFVWSTNVLKEQNVNHNGYKSSDGAANGRTNGYKNGAHEFKELQLYQIGAADNHALIADVCRELYEERLTAAVQSILKKREILTERINELLDKRLGFAIPEPDLGIIFSRDTCTYGLLPWHIRFTEFYTHTSWRYFDAKSFANVLYRYSRCEQRWGK